MIESGGNVLTNQSGRGFTWEIQFRQQPVSGNDGETPRQFSRHNLWQTAALDYRGYQSTDMLYTREMLENRGQQALIQVAGKMATRLQTSIEQKLAVKSTLMVMSQVTSCDFRGWIRSLITTDQSTSLMAHGVALAL